MPDASSLHCPNCGAAAEPEAGRCPFCKARLATVSCPSCFGLIYDGAAFCPRCGVRRARVERDETGVKCPGCRAEMQRTEIGTTSLLECRACDGVWLDADDFERICADREVQAAVLHRLPARDAVKVTGVRYRPCAQCGKMMNRVNFGKVSGTVVDVCKGHGTYLDAGELHRIVAFIHAGGMERARARQIQELREEQQRLRDLETRAARDRGKADPHSSLELSRTEMSPGVVMEILKAIRRS